MAGPPPRVGVAAILVRTDSNGVSILMGLRKGSHGAGTWALPGGHLEYGEHFLACAEREMLEETGLYVKSKRFIALTNDLIPAQGPAKHYITLFILCEAKDAGAEPEIKEPDKCQEWRWIPWSTLRATAAEHASSAGSSSNTDLPLFQPMVNLVEEYPDLEKDFLQ